ncbi:DUF3696 domain-containing protein [Qipengyuania sp. XHP0211]|uniref:DUF3696 domain-containing protein n=1 Tax=Qipengyuania sp. XHP0211 TaxID=3038079 RepID=UPI00241D9C3B|nr:DUF3696 domain-containing protein [Qipengyuania sp. XHP0211]MDG5750461.1 DUF3696 domain-containing protein [Qipengyuania sp. XHP0211]
MTSPLTSLRIEQFKCFADLQVPLRHLTLFTGFNGAGKSTAIQSLLLLAQGAKSGSWVASAPESFVPLNGDIVRLGSIGDVVRAGAPGGRVRFEVASDTETIELSLTGRSGARVLSAEATDGSPNDQLLRSLDRLVHISAVRSGPADSFPMPDRPHTGVPDVGVDGRFASYWYHARADEPVAATRCLPGSEGDTFRRQLDAWLDFLAPGANANVQILPVASALALQFRLSGTGEWKRPANVGYGLTYAFPILVQLLASAEGDVVVIDSPEAHLHPQAQSRMGRLLAAFAAAGVQILVETHSDHVLNGVRLAVADGVMPAAELGILFFAGASETDHGVTIPVTDVTGRIDSWPEGFFDQIDNDVARLSGWR